MVRICQQLLSVASGATFDLSLLQTLLGSRPSVWELPSHFSIPLCNFSPLTTPCKTFSCPAGFAGGAADAAHADDTATAADWRSPEEGGGRRPRWEEAEISGKKPSRCHALQTEEEGLGDVTGKESRRAHPDKHAASGASHCLHPWRHRGALCAWLTVPLGLPPHSQLLAGAQA